MGFPFVLFDIPRLWPHASYFKVELLFVYLLVESKKQCMYFLKLEGSQNFIQVSGPLMVYGFCQGRTRFTISHICNVYDFVESLSYELQPPTISFSTGNERTRFFLLWVQHTFSIVYPWWYMDVLSATELSLNRTRWFFIRYDSWGIS